MKKFTLLEVVIAMLIAFGGILIITLIFPIKGTGTTRNQEIESFTYDEIQRMVELVPSLESHIAKALRDNKITTIEFKEIKENFKKEREQQNKEESKSNLKNTLRGH